MKRVLAVVAHPDDEIIGVGGTLYKHVTQGDEVHVLILGDGRSSRKTKYTALTKDQTDESNNETGAAMNILKIKYFYKEFLADNRFDHMVLLDLAKIVSEYIKKIQPNIVYTHHYGDLNIDHQMTAEATIIGCRPIENDFVETLLMFETLSSTEMAGSRVGNLFLPNYYIDISEELATKIKSMGCYKSELRKFPHPRSLEAIEANAKVWGAKNNLEAAEAFYLFKSIVKKA